MTGSAGREKEEGRKKKGGQVESLIFGFPAVHHTVTEARTDNKGKEKEKEKRKLKEE